MEILNVILMFAVGFVTGWAVKVILGDTPNCADAADTLPNSIAERAVKNYRDDLARKAMRPEGDS